MTTIRVAQQVQLLYAKGWGPGCLANTDLVNPVFFGHGQSLDSSSDQIPALGAIPVDGSRDIYGSTQASGITVAVQSMPGVTNWTPSPAQVSAQINALGLAKDATVGGIAGQVAVTGAPPLVFKNVIDLLVGQSVAAGATLTRPASGKFSINQPGYELLLNVGQVGGTAAVISVELQWFDSFSGNLVDDEIYYFFSGDVNGHQVHGRGPSKGDRLVVVVRNYSGASGVSFSYVLLQTSRTFTREFWKTVTRGAVAPVFPGFTTVSMNPSANTIGADSSNVAANTTKILVLPFYTGTVRLSGITSDTVVNNTEWEIVNATDQVTAQAILIVGNGETGFAPTGPSSAYVPEVPLPRAQCTLDLVNRNTTTGQTISTNIVAQEDRA